MLIKKPARAGTLESSDIFVTVQPNENQGIEIQLESIVMEQFGEEIRAVILETIKELGVDNILVIANDRGALDYAIKARLETAIRRAI